MELVIELGLGRELEMYQEAVTEAIARALSVQMESDNESADEWELYWLDRLDRSAHRYCFNRRPGTKIEICIAESRVLQISMDDEDQANQIGGSLVLGTIQPEIRLSQRRTLLLSAYRRCTCDQQTYQLDQIRKECICACFIRRGPGIIDEATAYIARNADDLSSVKSDYRYCSNRIRGFGNSGAVMNQIPDQVVEGFMNEVRDEMKNVAGDKNLSHYRLPKMEEVFPSDHNLSIDQIAHYNRTPDTQQIVIQPHPDESNSPVLKICFGCAKHGHTLEECVTPRTTAFNPVLQHTAWLKAKFVHEENEKFFNLGVGAISALKDLFECRACQSLPREMQIYTCSNNHVICLKCVLRLQSAKCPTCRKTLTTEEFQHNKLLTNLYPELITESKLFCTNTYVGCMSDAFALSELESHERHCQFQAFPCPILHTRGYSTRTKRCDDIVGYQGLAKHLRDQHAINAITYVRHERDEADWKEHVFKTHIDFLHLNLNPIIFVGSRSGTPPTCPGKLIPDKWANSPVDEMVAILCIRKSGVEYEESRRCMPLYNETPIHFSVFMYYGNIEKGITPKYTLKVNPREGQGGTLTTRTISGQPAPWTKSTRRVAEERLKHMCNAPDDTLSRHGWDNQLAMNLNNTLLGNLGEELTVTMRDVIVSAANASLSTEEEACGSFKLELSISLEE